MLIMGQANRIWHYWSGKYPGAVGVLTAPSYGSRVPLDPWMPFVLDNDAFTCWRDNKPWDEQAWFSFLAWVDAKKLVPLWATVPDVVTNREATIANWPKYAHHIKRRGWPAAFCVQDGMVVEDVPKDADVVFVGGSDDFKFPTLPMWTANFPRVHCARVNPIRKIELCERLGCESVDGTSWFRDPSRKDRLPALTRYLAGVRLYTSSLL